MITIEQILIQLIKKDVPNDKLREVKKAYDLASEIHQNQTRQSGEPYIIHPLTVAQNILDMEVYDPDTISAALLHDTIEDAEKDRNFSKNDIASIINSTVAELVDGVSKINRLEFSTKQEQNLANMRKIMNGLTKDVRIIIIKLADRLHNMRTLDFKSPEKQVENSKETLKLFVPLSSTIGAYKIKSELEDLSFKYISPEEYKKIVDKKALLAQYKEVYLKEMSEKIQEVLNNRGIPNDILLRTKNVYTTYKRYIQGYKLENIYDLFYLKVLVDKVEDCFQTLALVHQNYPPFNGRFKDYIYNPRTNLYQSLHTTVSNKNNELFKVKIRTYDMDKVSAFGISARWNIKNGQTIQESQAEICEKFQFAKKLREIDDSFADDYEFVEKVSNELLTEHVYVYNNNGEIIEIPSGSTAFDFACHVDSNILDKITGVLVNGKEESINYLLKNNDRIQLLTKGTIEPTFENIPRQKKLV